MKRLRLGEKPVVVVDVETTGLDETVHEIVEISIITLKGDILLHTKVKPVDISTAHPKALEVNGYNEADWEDAPTWNEIAPQVKAALTNVVLLGQNISFDMRFINEGLKKTDVGNQGVSYHTVDTVTMAYEHLVPCGLRSVSLAAVCEFLGLSNKGAHTALVDTVRTLQVYRMLNRATWLNRLWWRLVGPRRAKAAKAAYKASKAA